MKKYIAACFLSLGLLSAAQAADMSSDHQALRQLNQELTTALNKVDFDALKGLLAENFDITFADQRSFSSLQGLRDYYKEMTTTGPLQSIQFHPTVDDLTRFVGTNVGIARGTSVDAFTRKDGRTLDIHSRWTAVLVKEGGRWKVSALHAGVNVLDNEYLRMVVGAVKKVACLVSIAALVIGLGLGWFLGRRKTA